jgi:prephenate dehydrogenase
MADRATVGVIGPTLGIIGLGHIGGSLARALPGCVAWTRSAATRAGAAEAGIDVRETLAEVVEAVDVVVLAPPLPALADVLDQVAAVVNGHEHTPTITDVGSVKAPIAAHAAKVLDDPGAFVPGHPLAGTEQSGWASADAAIFAGTTWALVVDEPVDLDRWYALAGLLCRLGVSVVPTTSAQHDAVLAWTSHLPYLLGGLMARRMLGWPQGGALSGGSLASMTRVVSTSDGARFGAELAAANRQAVAATIDDLIEDLMQARDELRGPSPEHIAAMICPVPEHPAPEERTVDRPDRSGLIRLGQRGGSIVLADGQRVAVRRGPA